MAAGSAGAADAPSGTIVAGMHRSGEERLREDIGSIGARTLVGLGASTAFAATVNAVASRSC